MVIEKYFYQNMFILFFSRGLLSAHILSEYVKDRIGVMQWYRGELLEMAKDIGYRLLPAFNTSTGIPQARVCLLFQLILKYLFSLYKSRIIIIIKKKILINY